MKNLNTRISALLYTGLLAVFASLMTSAAIATGDWGPLILLCVPCPVAFLPLLKQGRKTAWQK